MPALAGTLSSTSSPSPVITQLRSLGRRNPPHSKGPAWAGRPRYRRSMPLRRSSVASPAEHLRTPACGGQSGGATKPAGHRGGACAAVPWSTSQSTVMVRSPSFRISTAARRGGPTRRWISAERRGELQLSDVPLGALPAGPGQHGVLRRDPPLGDVGRRALHRKPCTAHGCCRSG